MQISVLKIIYCLAAALESEVGSKGPLQIYSAAPSWVYLKLDENTSYLAFKISSERIF